MGSFERKLKRNKLKNDLKSYGIKRKAPLTAYEKAIKKTMEEQKEKLAEQVYEEMLKSFQNSNKPVNND